MPKKTKELKTKRSRGNRPAYEGVSGLRLTRNPVPGKLYVIGFRQTAEELFDSWEDSGPFLEIKSEKLYETTWDINDWRTPTTYRKAMGEIPEGSIIFYLGNHPPGWFKIGYLDIIGLLPTSSVEFFEVDPSHV